MTPSDRSCRPGPLLVVLRMWRCGGPGPEWERKGDIHPGKVLDITLPLDDAAEGYRAMDERPASKTLLTV